MPRLRLNAKIVLKTRRTWRTNVDNEKININLMYQQFASLIYLRADWQNVMCCEAKIIFRPNHNKRNDEELHNRNNLSQSVYFRMESRAAPLMRCCRLNWKWWKSCQEKQRQMKCEKHKGTTSSHLLAMIWCCTRLTYETASYTVHISRKRERHRCHWQKDGECKKTT